MPRTTVTLAKLCPLLYQRRDATGDWQRLLRVLESFWNDLISSPDTRAVFQMPTVAAGVCDSQLASEAEGAAGLGVKVSFQGGAALGIASDLASKTEAITFVPGVTTVGDVEDAIAAVSEQQRLVRVVRSGTRTNVLQASNGFSAWAVVGGSPSGLVLGKVSIDAMTDIRDPTKAERRLLPYLAQQYGWSLDVSLPDSLQRKVVALVTNLYREKGTPAGIVAALRLLLGLDVEYQEWWADGWQIDVDALNYNTVIAPAETADGYSEGKITCVDPSEIADFTHLQCVAWTTFYWFRHLFYISDPPPKSQGWLNCPYLAQISDGLTLLLPRSDDHSTLRTYVFKRSTNFIAPAGVGVIDVSNSATKNDVASAVAAALNADYSSSIITQQATASASIIRLDEQVTAGTSGNVSIGGTAAALFDAYGMQGGVDGAGTSQYKGVSEVNLVGAETAEDVAKILSCQLAFEQSLITRRVGNMVYLESTKLGPSGDGLIGGDAATLLGAQGMTGGVGVNPSVLSFRIIFPRHLTDQEVRAAQALVNAMKRAETHWCYVNPPDPPVSLWRLGRSALGAAQVASGGSSRVNVPLRGSIDITAVNPSVASTRTLDDDDDLYGASSLGTVLVPLGAFAANTAARSEALPVGTAWNLYAENNCYVRQGNRQVTATASDCIMPHGTTRRIVVLSTGDAYVSALTAPSGGVGYLRLTQVGG